MVTDLHRATGGTEISDRAILERIARHARRTRKAVERLVEIEEARHTGEAFLQAALEDGASAGPIDLATLDFVRTSDRKFLVRENGVLREPTPAEAAVLAGTVNGANRRDRNRR